MMEEVEDFEPQTCGFRDRADTQFVQMDIGQIQYALEHDLAFLLNFFLGEEVTGPPPEFHFEAWSLLTSTALPRIALALPREHAKTTLARLAVVWYFLFTPIRFCIYVSNTHQVASESCLAIMNFIRSDNFVAVFGPAEFITQQDQRGYFKFIIRRTLPDGSVVRKVCILRALGAGMQVRGLNVDNQRPELAVSDDLEDDGNAGNEELVKKLERWFWGAFYKALSKRTRKLIYLGNMISNKSLIHGFCKEGSGFSYMRYGCLKSDGQPLWPELYSLDDIHQEYKDYKARGQLGLWFAEMMNLPVADGSGLIKPEEIYYLPPIVAGEQEAAFITIDPAIKRQTWNDNTAIVVHALVDGIWRVVDQAVGKFTPDDMFMLLRRLCVKWRTRCVGVEEAGYQVALKYLFEVLMVYHQYNFEVFMIPHHNVAKTERLAVWCSFMRKKQWAISEDDIEITQQLLAYDPSKKQNSDDLIDSCAMGPTMKDLYFEAIMRPYEDLLGLESRTRSGYEVCAI